MSDVVIDRTADLNRAEAAAAAFLGRYTWSAQYCLPTAEALAQSAKAAWIHGYMAALSDCDPMRAALHEIWLIAANPPGDETAGFDAINDLCRASLSAATNKEGVRE